MGRKMWKIELDGREHDIVFNRALLLGRSILIIDGENIPLPNNLYSNYIGYDLSIKIGDKQGRLVSLGSWSDIVIDGHYVNSGKPYIPLEEFKWWSWFFVFMCALVVVYSRIGSLSIIIALFGVMWSLQVSVCPELSIKQKLIYSFLIVVGVWALSIGVVNLFLI
ncbi:MAG: hypothetical protein FD141_535 [Fusobacteria bacterium]|nr:MAG: hypothetical protein FD141_535 [Fusobacteriota bacterium]KAF0228800.1 MAG: hypothetical protein FD182_1056 [Fusobacteriota bacterium]